MGLSFKHFKYSTRAAKLYSNVSKTRNEHRCKLLVVGGGTGGCSIAWRFSRKLPNKEIIVLEPSRLHYFQPAFTMVAAGMQQSGKCHRPMQSVLPRAARWICDHVDEFDPCNNLVHTRSGDIIAYEYMVIAIGLINDYEKIPGLKQALNYPRSGVSTIYSPAYCVKTWCCIKQFRGGHAIFTFPHTIGKCSGAALKIMYLADDYWRQSNTRHITNITYNTGGQQLFGIKKYADALSKVVHCRDIAVNYCTNLVEVNEKGAVFAEAGGNTITLPFNLLHVTPPMSTPTCLKKCTELVNEDGFLDVDMYTLQHLKYGNIYGIGDCTSTPNSKTAAAIASQSCVVECNLSSTMGGHAPKVQYDGYGACPLLTSYKTGMLAEFLYDKKVRETFPFDQSKERKMVVYLMKYILPYIYWNCLIKGKWDGPATIRKFINPFGR